MCNGSDQYIDLVIPRGSGEMVKYIKVSLLTMRNTQLN